MMSRPTKEHPHGEYDEESGEFEPAPSLKDKLIWAYVRTDSKIINTLTERGQKRKTVRLRPHPSLAQKSTEDYDSLLKVAKEYDVKEFFAFKKRKKSNLRMSYRVTAKAYRTSRDTGLVVAKKIYHLRKGRRT